MSDNIPDRPKHHRGGAASPAPDAERAEAPTPEEATLASLQADLQSGRMTARALTQYYLDRIERIDRQGPALNSVIELNPEALSIADALDDERRASGARGPLHGIPILLKDNIDTADRMQTTAGSLALVGSPAAQDAFLVRRLRQAGAILLGKTNMSEWANFRSDRSTSGWSGRGELTRNPYALDRNSSGSSSGSGVAIAANLAAAAIGTETDGSITSPASVNGLVGLKPTLGLVSRAGIIPIAHSQDTAGPMTRTVADAAILLGVLAGEDPEDPITRSSRGKAFPDYTRFLDAGGLRDARIGVARRLFGTHPQVKERIALCLEALQDQGAVLVDPADIPNRDKFGEAEFKVLLYEFKADLNRYLATRGPDTPVHTLAELIAFNARHADRELPFFGQELLERAQAKGPLTDPDYRRALARCRRYARTEGIDRAIREHSLDAILAPTASPAWMTDLVNGDCTGDNAHICSAAAVAGYPHITVPAGLVHGLPVGLSFIGPAYSEPTLIRLAYAFEQATRFRMPPEFLPTARTA